MGIKYLYLYTYSKNLCLWYTYSSKNCLSDDDTSKELYPGIVYIQSVISYIT